MGEGELSDLFLNIPEKGASLTLGLVSKIDLGPTVCRSWKRRGSVTAEPEQADEG